MSDRDQNNNDFFTFLDQVWQKGKFLARFVAAIVLAITVVKSWYQKNPQDNIVALVTAIIIIFVLICIYYGFKHPEKRKNRPWAIFGLVLITLLIVEKGLFYRYQANLPPKDFRILVANFEASAAQDYQVTKTIVSNLRQQMQQYEDVKVEKLDRIVDSPEAAKEIGKQKKAAIVIWGDYQAIKNTVTVPIDVNFQIIQKQDNFPELGKFVQGKVQTAQLAELESLEFQTNLADELSYLTLFTLGVYRYLNKDWSQAIICFEQALEEVEEKQNKSIASLGKDIIYLQLGNSFASNESYEKALDSYDKAIEIQPNYADAWNNRGLALSNLSKYQKAIASYNQAIEIQPDYVNAWNNRGAALEDLGKYKQAISDFDRAIKIQPDYVKAWYNRGTTLGNLGKYKQAISDFDRAIEIQPDYVNAWNNRGAALVYLGKYKQAISNLNKAIKIQSDLASAWYNKAALYARQNKINLALQNLKQAFKLNPNLKEYIKTDTGFDGIRSNRRFQNLITSKH